MHGKNVTTMFAKKKTWSLHNKKLNGILSITKT